MKGKPITMDQFNKLPEALVRSSPIGDDWRSGYRFVRRGSIWVTVAFLHNKEVITLAYKAACVKVGDKVCEFIPKTQFTNARKP